MNRELCNCVISLDAVDVEAEAPPKAPAVVEAAEEGASSCGDAAFASDV
jgi:hypothetical protein